MFIEPASRREPPHLRTGWIEVISGSMFSGKTEELIRRLTRARIARLHVVIVKPGIDTRYHDADIVSHNALSINSIPVLKAFDILLHTGNCDVVGIDEAQFFDADIVEVCDQLANQGKRVIIAGNIATNHTNGMNFGDVLSHCHELRHTTEGLARKIHV